jgi:thiosulfate/3-mercaptopyruvate sulfurtransferase
MSNNPSDALVSTEWLAANLSNPSIRIFDTTSFLPNVLRDAEAEYEECHIPGAVRFSVDDIADKTSGLPHMLLGSAAFAEAAGNLGVNNDTKVIAYDANGGTSASARAWWNFRVFGHDNIAILEGGLPKWLAEERATEGGVVTPLKVFFKATFRPELVRSRQDLIANVESKASQVVDARTVSRFKGQEPEPRPSKKVGHIPGSMCVPVGSLVDPEAGMALRSPDEIAKRFIDAGVNLDGPIITTCGSGVTAAFLALGLYTAGRTDVAVYDGSWAEWGNADDTPVEI